MRQKKEAAFEKRVKKHFRGLGYNVFHLAGPAGWPDLFIENALRNCRHIELKSTRAKNWRGLFARNVFEPSQLVFPLTVSFPIWAMIETVEGVFEAILYINAGDMQTARLDDLQWFPVEIHA